MADRHRRHSAAHQRPSVRKAVRGGKAAPVHGTQTPTAEVMASAAAKSGPSLTRRQVLFGAAGVAGIAALIAAGYSISEGAESDPTPRLSVPESSVFTTDDCELLSGTDGLFAQTASFKLPYGSQLWSGDGMIAVALLPSETASPLVTVSLLHLQNATTTPVLSAASGQADGFEIFDARACPAGLIWLEANVFDGRWRVLSMPLAEGTPTGAAGAVLAEGDSQWEMPTLAACGNYAWWQLLPQLGGDHQSEDSVVYRAPFGAAASSAEEVYRSHGRFSTALTADADSVTIAPRSEGTTSSYELVNLDAKSGQTVDKIALPSSMAPTDAAYTANGFAFTFNAIYNYGGGFANLGTYGPVSAEAAGSGNTDAYGALEWFRFNRAPTALPASCGDWFIVKSTSAVCAVDLARRRYAAFDVPNGADSYGEYLASAGNVPRIVTFANVDHTPIDGEAVYECSVRVWEPTGATEPTPPEPEPEPEPEPLPLEDDADAEDLEEEAAT